MNNVTDRIQPRPIGVDESSGPSRNRQIVEIYVCPTGGCKNYYGSSSMGHLEQKEVRRSPHAEKNPGELLNYRDKCPDCGARRERKYAIIVDEAEVAEAKAEIQRLTRNS